MENEDSKTTKTTKRIMKGVVVADKMDKTVVVAINRLKEHPKYRKRYRLTKKYKVHDANNEFHVGDMVLIQETKPISKGKKWEVIKLVKKGLAKIEIEEGEEEETEEKEQQPHNT